MLRIQKEVISSAMVFRNWFSFIPVSYCFNYCGLKYTLKLESAMLPSLFIFKIALVIRDFCDFVWTLGGIFLFLLKYVIQILKELLSIWVTLGGVHILIIKSSNPWTWMSFLVLGWCKSNCNFALLNFAIWYWNTFLNKWSYVILHFNAHFSLYVFC